MVYTFMKRKQPSTQSSQRASSDDRYEQLLADLHKQTLKIARLELLVYDLEGQQRNMEESIGEAERESMFLSALHRWIAEIDREIAREL